MNERRTHLSFPAALTIVVFMGACGGGGDDGGRPAGCFGKCDSGPGAVYASPYEADIAKMNQIWPGEPQITKVEDAYTVLMKLGEVQFPAPTHLFGAPVNVIPYSDEDNVTDAAGQSVARGDAVIANAFPPGQIGYAIKHHRPEQRTLAHTGEGSGEMKEHFKLQDTHIELVVGVMRDGQPGAITLNNPQSYQNGYFGNATYSMVFVRPDYPDYLSPEQKQAFNNNIRTMMAGFNAVSNFPGDYNGGDPLAANTVEKVVEHTANMIRAIGGDAEAIAFFEDPANLIYCAELAFVASSAGAHVPLNAATAVPLVGQEAWDAFTAEVEKHNRGEASTFLTMNENQRVAMVELTLAPEDLQPMPDYAPAEIRAAESAKLAFQPMTMADIVEQFLRTHIPREQVGEQLAPVQGAMLAQMKPGLLEAMGLDQIPEADPRRVAVDALFEQLVNVVSTPYESYQAFRTALEPLLVQARLMTGPRDETGTGLFVPPSLLHVVTQGKMPGGILGLEYVGHGIHFSACRLKEEPAEPNEPEPVGEPDEPFAGSCRASCGGFSPDVECACDEVCEEYGDCCPDYHELCPQ